MATTDATEELLGILLERASSEEQKTFFRNNAMYLQYDQRKDFIVDLDSVVEDIGFVRKGKAKESLVQHLELGIDYMLHDGGSKKVLPRPGKRCSDTELSASLSAPQNGGQNKETILMTVHGFKHLCMSVRTERGRETRRYFIMMEEVLLEYLKRKQSENNLNVRLARHETLLEDHIGVECTYVIIVAWISAVSYIIKVGETRDLKTRLLGLKSQYGMAILLDVFATTDAHGFEQQILHIPMFQCCKHHELVNGHRGHELFLVDAEHSYNVFFQPVIKKRFTEHAKSTSTYEECEQRLESRRLDLMESLLASTRFDASQIIEFVSKLRGGEKAGFPKVPAHPVEPETDQEPSSSARAARELEDLTTSGDDLRDKADASLDEEAPAASSVPYNAHRPMDSRVQQYDAVMNLVAVHEGIREAARALAGSKPSSVRTACLSNTLYLGHRWLLVDRDELSGQSRSESMPPTAPPRRREGRVAQLSPDASSIMTVYQDQVAAAESVGLAGACSITNALKKGMAAKGFRWARLEDCSAEMMAAWTAAGSPEGPNRGSRRGHQVCLIDPTSGEVVRTFDTMSDAVHAMRTSHKQIHTSFQKQAVYMGFRWTVV